MLHVLAPDVYIHHGLLAHDEFSVVAF
jgi:hypothetical protein